MFFEKTGGPIWDAVRATLGAGAAGYGSWEANQGMELRSRASTAAMAAAAGAVAGKNPRLWLNPSRMPFKGLLASLVGGELLGQKFDSAIKSNMVVPTEIAKNQAASNLMGNVAPMAIGGAGILGLGALGSYLSKPNKGSFTEGGQGFDQGAPGTGRMTLTLPPSKHNPTPTVLDLPITGLRIPKKTMSHIGRDTRRVLKLNSAERDVDLAHAGV